MRSLIKPVTCPTCKRGIGLQPRIPPNCPICDAAVTIETRARMGTKWLVKVLLARLETRATAADNKIGVVYNCTRQLNYTTLYSKQGLVSRADLLSVIRQLGLVVEQNRNYYFITESPQLTREMALDQIPEFEGLREIVTDAVEDELDETEQSAENWPKSGTAEKEIQRSILNELLDY